MLKKKKKLMNIYRKNHREEGKEGTHSVGAGGQDVILYRESSDGLLEK